MHGYKGGDGKEEYYHGALVVERETQYGWLGGVK